MERTPTRRRSLPPTTTWAVPALVLLGACGREDSIWTGLSGVVLFILIAWAAIHFIRR